MFTRHTASGGGVLVRLVLAVTLLVLLAVTLLVVFNRPGTDDTISSSSLSKLADRRVAEQQWLDSIS